MLVVRSCRQLATLAGSALLGWAAASRRHRRPLCRRAQATASVVDRWVESQVIKAEGRGKFDEALSRQAKTLLEEVPTPARNQEPWRYTNIAALFEEDVAAPRTPPPADVLAAVASLIEESTEDAIRLVFVDGILDDRFSRQSSGDGSFIGGGTSLRSQSAQTQERIGELLRSLPELDIFLSNARDSLGCAKLAAVNQILFEDCALVCCPEDVGVSGLQPPLQVEVTFISTGARSCSSPRLVIDAQKNSRLHIIESHLSLNASETSLSNGICRVVLAEGAQVDHDFLQQKAEGARFVHSLTAELGAEARYHLRLVQSGARIARVNAAMVLAGESSSCKVSGIMLANQQQQLALHSLIHHVAPGCRSEQPHKNIVTGMAECIFKGSIRVDKEAQKTDSSQLCRSLLLTKKAAVKAMPSLQIQADDVTCSHGAAVTELDENQEFYMRSRGLDPGAARKLLLVAFPQDLLGNLGKSVPKAYQRLLDKLVLMAEPEGSLDAE